MTLVVSKWRVSVDEFGCKWCEYDAAGQNLSGDVEPVNGDPVVVWPKEVPADGYRDVRGVLVADGIGIEAATAAVMFRQLDPPDAPGKPPRWRQGVPQVAR